MGYDDERVHGECEARDSRPTIPLRETVGVKRGEHKPPTCEHDEWRFAGADPRRGGAKWWCPTGECYPASRWVKADRLHPLSRVSRSAGSRSVEREFGRLKMSGRYRSACVGSSGFGSMPTSRSSPSRLSAQSGASGTARGRALGPPVWVGLAFLRRFTRGLRRGLRLWRKLAASEREALDTYSRDRPIPAFLLLGCPNRSCVGCRKAFALLDCFLVRHNS